MRMLRKRDVMKMTSAANSNLPSEWWSVPGEYLAELIGVNPVHGLATDQVRSMKVKYGINSLPDQGSSSMTHLLWQSIKSPMMILLLAIAGISLALSQYREAVVMAFVVAIYILVELINKRRSDRTMARLRELQLPTSIVMRDGHQQEIPISDLCVGDILVVQTGTKIAADARLLSSTGLLVNESSLTGESAAQTKNAAAEVLPEAALAERPTAIFSGTTVLDGQGLGIVMAVGLKSELGRIASLTLNTVSAATPSQKEMRDLARTLAVAAIGISCLIPLAGWLRGYDLYQMLLTWLSLTFLMIPGQPPVIITMALALAAFELARKKVIVRSLRGAETLGSVNIIISDKTGTMTENAIVLDHLILGNGSELAREQTNTGKMQLWQNFFARVLPAVPEISSNPIDLALIKAAGEMKISNVRPAGRLVHQVGFVTGNFYRSLEYKVETDWQLYLAGSPEFIIEHSTQVTIGGQTSYLNDNNRKLIMAVVRQLASEGKRITAYAYKNTKIAGGLPDELIFAGCAVFSDPIRPEVKGAVAQLTNAGIRTIMVTGDNAETAVFVARSVGLNADKVVVGTEIDRFSDLELLDTLHNVQVFARMTPENKLRLVEVLKQDQQIVAVTGDGINDAPALSKADIGVAMGIKGTDVARETADLIITDDNFVHLTDAVAIGRKAYDNFRKGITYYLSAKAVLLTVFLVPLVIGKPFPFSPIQIIAIELLMDLASSTIFVSEAAEPDVMNHKPRPRVRFLSLETGRLILRNMLGLTIGILGVFFGSLSLGYDITTAQTAAFATWLLGHVLLALIVKQNQTPLLKFGILTNRIGAGWLAGMVVMVLAMTLVPSLYAILNTTFLPPVLWVMVIGGAILASGWIEIFRLFNNPLFSQKHQRFVD